VDQIVAQMPKGPYREVLDWLVEQVDRLEAHALELAAHAERGELDQQAITARRAAIAQAHEWLAEQLAAALQARGMRVAA
jgi:hypothetical protein